MRGQIRLISGSANRPLAEEVAKILGIKLTPVRITKFADGETYVRILESIRGQDVYIIQPTGNPVNENLMELLLMIDALRRASAGSICAVMPFFGYARQDRKATSREPISAKLVANLISVAGANRVIACDLHAPQVQGFFDIPLDHLEGLPLISNYFKKKKIRDAVVVSPDIGGIKMNRKLAERLKVPLVLISKRRSLTKPDTVEEMEILGDVKGKNIIMTDDEINTAGTMVRAVELLKEAGARDIYVSATHAVLAGEAVQRLSSAPVKEVVVTNTLSVPEEKSFPKLRVVSIAKVVAETIRIINQGRPMGVYLENL